MCEIRSSEVLLRSREAAPEVPKFRTSIGATRVEVSNFGTSIGATRVEVSNFGTSTLGEAHDSFQVCMSCYVRTVRFVRFSCLCHNTLRACCAPFRVSLSYKPGSADNHITQLMVFFVTGCGSVLSYLQAGPKRALQPPPCAHVLCVSISGKAGVERVKKRTLSSLGTPTHSDRA